MISIFIEKNTLDINKIFDIVLIKEIIAPIIIIISGIVLYQIANIIMKKSFNLKVYKIANRQKKTLFSLINNIIKYVIIAIVVLMILDVYGIETKTILASIGILGLVIGLAVQDTLRDFISGVFIILDNQYSVGDNVMINGFRGTVINLGLKTTRIKAYTGEIKVIANRNIMEVINYSKENSLAIIDVSVLYDDMEKTEKILTELCQQLSTELSKIKGPVQFLGVNKVTKDFIEYRIIVETVPLANIEIENKIKLEVKQTLNKNKIEVTYQ